MGEIEIDEARRPVVIVDGLHIKYRVFSSGKAVRNSKTSLLTKTRRGIRPAWPAPAC